jgi:glycosyltransferase involved in cell wall biosynthesis
MIKDKKLTICIPTFNRLKFVENQLGFFKEQFKNNKLLMEYVEVIVADNASTDNTALLLSEYKNKHQFFNYVVNTSNLGLVGNVVNLLNLSKTEYVWFVSDDDDLKNGVVEKILEIIKNTGNPELIYLNYSLNGNPGFTGDEGLREDSKKAVLDVFREHYGSLVLITACVYKRNNLNELSNNPMFKWLSAPLLYSFYSGAKGPVYLTNEVWIDYRIGNASYSGLKTISKLKFEEYVPILESLPKYGFDKLEIKKTIKLFFEAQSHSHLIYNFVNLRNSLRLYKYYTFKTAFKLPIIIVQYLRK